MHQISPRSLLLRSALSAAERGWRVFPLVPGVKRPAIRSWESRATIDTSRITRCWSTATYNYGVACGPSGLVVVDLDVPKHDRDVPPANVDRAVTDGADVFADLAEKHGQRSAIETFTVRTASGGTHLYFTAPADVELRNSAGALGWKVDTRACGGYVVGAGSRVDAKRYTVVHDTAPVPLPNWLARLLAPAALPPQRPVAVPLTADGRHSSYLLAALNGERDRVARSAEGGRNDALYQASVALGQLVAGGELTEAEVTEQLLAPALGVGLAEPDIRRTIVSGLWAGAKRPRTIAGRRAA
ncbi:bifunctional DNA primase/polymerase [Streptomyces sp. NA04227]|uniref:bifunctional DNA primase/polymerase n=1 Tax=Streptomyces sp. NA04227 TaxID=2742136 RepID=UPI001591EB59|nr:bifunctional DNA primase/polymerase [Streptomyces sp. NA04227]QKW07380.1 bifunctional DNA primase/polymerase [Streptomyces sp. NA04227]